MARRTRRRNVFDWMQNILDETKDLVDDGFDRLRDDDDDDDRLTKEVHDLKRTIVDLSAKLDALVAQQAKPAAKTTP